MSNELRVVEKIVEEVPIDIMIERVMSERAMSTSIQASSMRGLQASSLSAHGFGSSRPSAEKRTKHK